MSGFSQAQLTDRFYVEAKAADPDAVSLAWVSEGGKRYVVAREAGVLGAIADQARVNDAAHSRRTPTAPGLVGDFRLFELIGAEIVGGEADAR